MSVTWTNSVETGRKKGQALYNQTPTLCTQIQFKYLNEQFELFFFFFGEERRVDYSTFWLMFEYFGNIVSKTTHVEKGC